MTFRRIAFGLMSLLTLGLALVRWLIRLAEKAEDGYR